MRPTRVLIVDDDTTILRMLEFGLKKLGADYHIFTAASTQSAIAQIEKQLFDVILTDYMMPGLTGVDLARAIHRLSPDTQIILMTAHSSLELRHTSNHVGFDGYLNKPFDIEEARQMIREASRRSSTEQKAQMLASRMPLSLSDAAKTAPAAPRDNRAELIAHQLQNLKANAGVRSVFLVKADGSVAQTAGQVDPQQAEDIGSLLHTVTPHTVRLAGLLNNSKNFRSMFYEGDASNLYACWINQGWCLVIIFDVKLRPGVVWFYTKQTAVALLPVLTP